MRRFRDVPFSAPAWKREAVEANACGHRLVDRSADLRRSGEKKGEKTGKKGSRQPLWRCVRGPQVEHDRNRFPQRRRRRYSNSASCRLLRRAGSSRRLGSVGPGPDAGSFNRCGSVAVKVVGEEDAHLHAGTVWSEQAARVRSRLGRRLPLTAAPFGAQRPRGLRSRGGTGKRPPRGEMGSAAGREKYAAAPRGRRLVPSGVAVAKRRVGKLGKTTEWMLTGRRGVVYP